MYGTINAGKSWRMRMNGQIRATAQETDNIKVQKIFFSLGWHGHVERINNERMPKQIDTARMEGIR
jgi:hypothetical protein